MKIIFTLLLFTSQAFAYYLPGIAPRNYAEGESIDLFSNTLRSAVTELPYEFYHPKLHFPQPEKLSKEPEGLGAILKGDRLVSTKFQVKMLEDKQCAYLGQAAIPAEHAPFLFERIVDQYYFTWYSQGCGIL